MFAVINIILSIVIVCLLIYLFLVGYYIETIVNSVENQAQVKYIAYTDGIIGNPHKILHYRLKYTRDPEDFFVDDIYKTLSDIERMEKINEDYLNLFISAIDNIVTNKQFYIDNFTILTTKQLLEHHEKCLPLLKFAKYYADYESYIQRHIDRRAFADRVQSHYESFTTDPLYFATVTSKTCTRTVHVIIFIKKVMSLYSLYPISVDNCVYYNGCVTTNNSQSTAADSDQQCQL